MKIRIAAPGRREVVSVEEARQILERWTRQVGDNNEVYSVDISCRAWSRESVDVLLPFFRQIAPTVKYVNFADIIASLHTDEGLYVMESLAGAFSEAPLQDIDLSDNAKGPRGLIRVESMIANTPLQRLYLHNCGLSSESLELLREWFLANDSRIARGMKDLVFNRNMSGAEGARVMGEILPHCTQLQRLSYLGCRLQGGTMFLANGIRDMCQAAPRCALRKLELDDCHFGEEEHPAYVPLAEAMERCSQLQHFDVPDGNFEVEGLTALIRAFETSGAQLKHLGLGK